MSDVWGRHHALPSCQTGAPPRKCFLQELLFFLLITIFLALAYSMRVIYMDAFPQIPQLFGSGNLIQTRSGWRGLGKF